MNDKKQPQEEVDIVLFFNTIGKLFKNLYQWILNLLKNVLFLLIRLILFLKRKWVYLAAGIMSGLILALIFNYNYKPVYQSEIYMKLNYHSYPALAGKIESLNAKIEQKDYLSLAKELKIDEDKASELMKFTFGPETNDVVLIKEYEQYRETLDTSIYHSIPFDIYKKEIKNNENLSSYAHLRLTATSPDIFHLLNPYFESVLENDPILAEQRKEHTDFLNEKINYLNRSLVEIDSLRKVFDEVYLNAATKSSNTGVIVNTSQQASLEEPYDLFQKRIELLDELKKTKRELLDKKKIVKFYNIFPESGKKTSLLNYNPFIKYPLMGFLVALIILLLFEFNKFLKHYKEKQITNEEN